MEAERAGLIAAGISAVALAVVAVGGAASRTPDGPTRGERLFRQCYACHSVTPGERGLAGPNLYGVVDRPMASEPGFPDYSATLRAVGAAGGVWTPAQLDRFITDPEAAMPGTTMGFMGMADAADRAALIAWLAERVAASPSRPAATATGPE